VSHRAVGYWTVRAVPGWLVLLAGQIIWWVISGADVGWHIFGLVVTVVAAAAHLLVMPRWRFHVHRWETSPEAVYTQSGWFTTERRIAPVSRIQTVDSKRGPIEAIFGLANVTVTTASAAGPVRIDGLDRDTAATLVDELTNTTQATPGDAT
jgi:uncharacterized protein